MKGNEKYGLFLKLQKIDFVLKKINEKWKRKRMINISYLIKRVLSEYDKIRADKIQLNLSENVLKFYDEWYDEYHYQNKIEEIIEKYGFEMSSNVKYELLKLMKINEKWKRKRKRLFTSYLIKRVLSDYDKTLAEKIKLHLSEKVLKFYDEWYNEWYDEYYD